MSNDVKTASGEPKTVPLKELGKYIGKFAVFFRNSQPVPGKIVSVDGEKSRVTYDLMAGPDKGKRMSARFDESLTARVYDDNNVMLAFMELSWHT